MEKSERFNLMMAPTDRATLERLAQHEDLSAAAVVRRLVKREAQRLGLVTPDRPQNQPQPGGAA